MTLHARIACAKAHPFGHPGECLEPYVELAADGDEILAYHVRKQLAERGWVIEDGEHYCPRHRPDDAGIPFDLPMADGEYHPIANSGWEARSILAANCLEVRPIRGRDGGEGVAA